MRRLLAQRALPGAGRLASRDAYHIRDYPRLPETTRDYPLLPKTARDYPRLQTTRDYPRLPETIDYPRLPETTFLGAAFSRSACEISRD